MAVKQTRVDDLDGKSEGAETVVFVSGGVFYEIDLVETNAKKLAEALASFVAKAREVSGKDALKQLGGGNGTASVDPSAVRAWCAAQTPPIEVNAKGRVPIEIIEKYLVAHAESPTT